MTRRSKRELEHALADLDSGLGDDDRIYVVSFADATRSGAYTPAEYEAEFGHPPEEHDGPWIGHD